MAMIKRHSTIDKALSAHRRRKKKKAAKRGTNGNGPERKAAPAKKNGNGAFDQAFLKRIGNLTHDNDHSEVRALLAERTGRPRIAKHIRAMRAALDDIDRGTMGIPVPSTTRSKMFYAMEALRSAVDKSMTPEQREALSGHW